MATSRDVGCFFRLDFHQISKHAVADNPIYPLYYPVTFDNGLVIRTEILRLFLCLLFNLLLILIF